MRKALILPLVASLLIGLAPAGSTGVEKLSVVRVLVDSPDQVRYLAGAFDETHNHRDGYVELLLWPGDAARLDALGLAYEVVIEDLVAHDAEALAQPGPQVALPGPDRSEYRVLEDYESEMRALAKANPGLVKLIRLPKETFEGRTVYGLEIAARVDAKADGRPYFHVDGVHHAREWPAGEYPMIFAHYLVERFGKDPRVTKLLNSVRVEIVPIVNVDGFDYSRDSLVNPQGLPAYPLSLLGIEAYWRKNRHSFSGVTVPVADRNPDAYGVDPNRNYSFFWGDDVGGSSGTQTNQTYRGEKPFSEPEVRNIRSLILSRQVTGLITNHTSGRLVLRPWGHTADDAPDEKALRLLGDRMAEAMGGYTNQKGIGLYATTGTTDDWYYAATGGYGYTYEHETSFHPPYADSVGAHWKGVIDAFMIGAEAAADPATHAVVKGRLLDANGNPVQGKITLLKSFKTPLWEGNPTGKRSVAETMTSQIWSNPDGTFTWHVNPSSRPLIVEKGGKEFYELLFFDRDAGFAEQQVYVERGEVLDLGDIVLDGDYFSVSDVIVIGGPPDPR